MPFNSDGNKISVLILTWGQMIGRCQQQQQRWIHLSSSGKASISRKHTLEHHTKGPVKHFPISFSQLSHHTQRAVWATCYTGALRLRTQQHCCTSQVTPGLVLSPQSMKCYCSSLKYLNFKPELLYFMELFNRPLQESECASGQVSSTVTH